LIEKEGTFGDTSVARLGVASCLVSGRSFVIATPVQVITQHMVKGRDYTASFWVRAVEEQDFFPVIEISCTGSFLPVILLGNKVLVTAGTWTLVSSTLPVSWTGTLNNAMFQIRSAKTSNYHIDDASLLNEDLIPGTRFVNSPVPERLNFVLLFYLQPLLKQS